MRLETLAAAGVAGLATGPRSFTGLAAVTFATPADARTQPDKVLAHPATKTAIGLLALQEWVMDKLPKTPSRLETLGLITRATGAGAAGAILARRAQVKEAHEASSPGAAAAPLPSEVVENQDPPPDWKAISAGAAAGAGVALGVAVIGVHLRSGFEKLFGGRDWPAAGLEDLSSGALAAGAVYLSTRI